MSRGGAASAGGTADRGGPPQYADHFPGRGAARPLYCGIWCVCFSEGSRLAAPMRVALVDERGELAAVHRGRPQLEVGPSTDILDGCPKAVGVPMLLRAMNPQVIALDEIALPEDGGAVLSAAGCGAAILATAHGASVEDLRRRTVMRRLLKCGVFRRAVVIHGRGAERQCRVEELL